jgi:hypothetical protein
MKAGLAIRLGILAIVALGFLSGCILLENSATIVFDNTLGAIDLDCVFDGQDFGTAAAGFWISSDYYWTGSTTIFVDWIAYQAGTLIVEGSGTIQVIDGLPSTIFF